MTTPTDFSQEHALFTEREYAALLDLAKEKYAFCGYDEFPDKPSVFWRHDVDHSAHRSLALAKLEAERGLRCAYHLLLTSRYYSIFEPEIGVIFREIAALGHEIGLHFDMDAFGETEAPSGAQMEQRIALEKNVIESIVGVSVRSMSFHNYVMNRERLNEREMIGGLFNCGSPPFVQQFKYVSDSNGIWRYDRLRDVLEQPPFPRLHVLTHPEWWTPDPMPPIARLRRIVDGRAKANFDLYAYQLRRDGRFATIGERIGATSLPGDMAAKNQ